PCRTGHGRSAYHQHMATLVLMPIGTGPWVIVHPQCRGILEYDWLDAGEHRVGNPDIGKNDLATKKLAWHQQVPGFLAEEGNGDVGHCGNAAQLTAGPVQAAGDVDGTDGNAARCDCFE